MLTKKNKIVLKPETKLLKWTGNPIKQVKYTGKFDKADVQDLSNKIKERLKSNQELLVTLNYGPQLGFKSSTWANKNSHAVELFSATKYSDDAIVEPAQFKNIYFYLKTKPSTKGGYDKENNDCLYNCLVQVIPKHDMPWKTPEEFKRFVGCKSYDKVDYRQLGNIENKLKGKYAITLTGDHTYMSLCKKAAYFINLKLYKEHYELAQKSLHLKQGGIATNEKQIAIYEYNDEENKIDIYSNNKYESISHEKLYSYINIPNKAPYLCVQNKKGENLKNYYTKFITQAEKLKAISNGELNLFKTGDFRKTALDLFYKLHKTLQIDIIEQIEANWIEKATVGAIVFAKKYSGKGYLYDFVSMYPSIQKDSKMLFPIKTGSFHKITNKEFQQKEFLQYGIYRAEVISSNDCKYNVIYRFNKTHHYYTHFDLNQAKKLGFEIKLIEDDEPNMLIYERNKLMQGHDLFGPYIDKLYPLKQQGVGEAKILLNILWGALCKKNKKTQKINIDNYVDNNEYANQSVDIKELVPLPNNNLLIKFTTDVKGMFCTKFARIKPFLLSRARAKIADVIYPIIDDVVFSHTDSILSTKPLNLKIIGKEMGQLKYEGYCKNCYVNNCKDKTKKTEFH